jgi:hypothetical protein
MTGHLSWCHPRRLVTRSGHPNRSEPLLRVQRTVPALIVVPTMYVPQPRSRRAKASEIRTQAACRGPAFRAFSGSRSLPYAIDAPLILRLLLHARLNRIATSNQAFGHPIGEMQPRYPLVLDQLVPMVPRVHRGPDLARQIRAPSLHPCRGSQLQWRITRSSDDLMIEFGFFRAHGRSSSTESFVVSA